VTQLHTASVLGQVLISGNRTSAVPTMPNVRKSDVSGTRAAELGSGVQYLRLSDSLHYE
jgi:hypothetical protein